MKGPYEATVYTPENLRRVQREQPTWMRHPGKAEFAAEVRAAQAEWRCDCGQHEPHLAVFGGAS